MLDLNDPVVKFKLNLLDRVLPAENVIVYGDMYVVDGGFTRYVAAKGAKRATLVDTLETRAWQQARLEHPTIDFYKGDFSNQYFMNALVGTFETGVAYDVLLHQPPLLHSLHLMLEKVEKYFVFAHPTLEEQPTANALIFLPGHPNHDLYPMAEPHNEYQAFSVEIVNQSQWIWGITASWMRAALATEGFKMILEDSLASLPNRRWSLWGGIAERQSWPDEQHWSRLPPYRGLYEGWER
jgi:hypothetical protein